MTWLHKQLGIYNMQSMLYMTEGEEMIIYLISYCTCEGIIPVGGLLPNK